MPTTLAVKRATERALLFLAGQQRTDGSLESYSSPTIEPFTPATAYRTTFVPALVLGALAGVDLPAARIIRDGLTDFLLAQKSPGWSFNYWAASAKQRATKPYPDDLDDTFCALTGLFLHDPAIIDEAALAGAVKLLVATETAVGGPYRTWLVPANSPKVWLDVDLAVNSNIAYFLSLVSQPLPNLTDFIDGAIAAGTLTSPYYPSASPLVYYISRGYGGRQKDRLASIIRELQGEPNRSPLDQALCLAALSRLGETDGATQAVSKLLAAQQADGSWPAAAFCLDPVRGKQPHYNGAAALTTAFVIEALRLAGSVARPAAPSNPKPKPKPAAETTRLEVLRLAKTQCRRLAPDLRSSLLTGLDKVASDSNGAEIIGLGRRFSQSLVQPLTARHDAFLNTLGLANLYGWLAYTIYDDFLDDEGQPALLPAANVAMRASWDTFGGALPDHPGFQDLVRRVFDAIDGANAWELAHCRRDWRAEKLVIDSPLPDYGKLAKLAERSLGHTLAPLAVLLARGDRLDGPAFKRARQALAHYLIARQLNDDAHDWQADFQRGHITYVVGRLMAETGLNRPGSYALEAVLPEMRRQFWHQTLPAICDEMQRHVDRGRQLARQLPLLRSDNVLADLLDNIETSLQATRATQGQAQRFLEQYKQAGQA